MFMVGIKAELHRHPFRKQDARSLPKLTKPDNAKSRQLHAPEELNSYPFVSLLYARISPQVRCSRTGPASGIPAGERTMNRFLQDLPQFRVAVIVAAVCGGLVSSACAVADDAADELKTARGLFQDKRWSLAEFAFRQFLVKHPKDAQVPLGTYYLGMSQLQLQKHADARTTLRSFVTKNANHPEVPHATYRIAECSYQLGDLDAAITEFDTALKKHPEESFRDFAWAYLGDAQRQTKQYREAAVNLRKALNGRMASEARFGLAQTSEALGQTDEAIKLYREVSADEKASRADAAQLGVANLLFGAGKYAESIVEYKHVESKFETSDLVSVARLNCGFANYQLGEFRAAMLLFDQAESDPKQRITAGYWKGLSTKALGDQAGAADVLEGVAKIAGDDPLTESIIYQLADSEYRSGDLDRAERWFLEVVDRWPRGRYADHSLYFAAECLMRKARTARGDERATHLKEAGLLLDRFDQDYSTSGIRLSHNLQRGQFLRLGGQPDDLARAEQIYQSVLSSSRQQATLDEARYQLALVRQSLGNTQGAVDAIRPLAEAVIEDPQRGLPQSLILYSQLARETGDIAVSVVAAQRYLDTQLKGELRPQAYSSLAMSGALGEDWAAADAALNRLITEHSESPLVSQTLLAVAQSAEDSEHWILAIKLYEAMIAPGKDSPYHANGLYGLAWCRHQNGEFAKAEQHCRDFGVEYPKHVLAPDAAFLLGESLRDAGDLEAAAAAFDESFRKHRPARQAFLSGVEAARAQFKLKKSAEGDKAYAAVTAAYPDVPEHDKLFHEWAMSLYGVEQFDRSDAVFRELIATHPESNLVDNARYSLAESELINGNSDAAKAEFLKLVSDEKSDSLVQEESLFRLVGINIEAEEWKDAIKYSGELTTRFPDGDYAAEAQFYQGDAHIHLKQYDQAETVLAALTKYESDAELSQTDWFPHTWVLLAEAQLQLKEYSDVLKTVDGMEAWNPESQVLYRIHEILGRACKNQAKFDEAREAFKRVTQSIHGRRTETAAKSQLMIAETWFLQEKYAEAGIEYFKVEQDYKFPLWVSAALSQLGKCYELMADKPSAIGTYRKLVAEYPDTTYAADAKKRLADLGAE
jgi:TolA-binding protein